MCLGHLWRRRRPSVPKPDDKEESLHGISGLGLGNATARAPLPECGQGKITGMRFKHAGALQTAFTLDGVHTAKTSP